MTGSTRTAVITGGTDGLGRALAIRYLQAGWRVVVLGRTDRRTFADSGATFLPVDLLNRDSLERVEFALADIGIDEIHRLIHCAGIGWVGPVRDQTSTSIDAMVAVNVWAPIALTSLLASFVERAKGRIVFVGSIAAFAPAPTYAVYAATKAAIDGFARSFRQEVAGRIGVQVIHPGPIRTAFHARAEAAEIGGARFPTPEDVADRVLRGMERRRWRVYSDVVTALSAGVATLARGFVDRILGHHERRTNGRAGNRISAVQSVVVPVAVVSGSGSGLGAAISTQLLDKGYRVLGVDLVPSSSTSAHEERFLSIAANIAEQCGIADIIAIVATRGKIDLLVHCAGTSDVGPFETRPLECLDRVIKTNLTGPMQLTARLLREGHLRDGGKLVFVSSLSHFVGYPGAAVYAASKDGLAHYACSIGLRANGQHCLTVFPGPMRTPHAARFAPAGAADRHRADPHHAAALILRSLARCRSRLVVGRGARLAMIIGLIAPSISTMIMRRTLFEQLRSWPPEPKESVL